MFSLRCGTSNGRVAVGCATGDGCPHLTTEQGHPMSRRDSIHGDKDRHSPCASAILRLERMPDIILFRDCTRHPFYHSLIVVLDRTVMDFFASLWFLFPYCHFLVFLIFHYDAVLKRRQFSWLQCCPAAFLYIGEAIFFWCVPEPCGSLLESLARINVWQRDIRVDPKKSPLCE